MIITRLSLRNYRRFAAVDIELPENIIGIIGRNGAGKTTLVEAIAWALYGNAISRTGKEDVRSQFAGERETCSVELEFVYGGTSYRIERKLKGKNAVIEAAIYRAQVPEPEAVQDRGVNEYVERLLRLDYRSFLASVFARQRELALFSNLKPEERRRAVNRLIGIDRIDRAREAAAADRNEKQSFVEGRQKGLIDPEILKTRREENETLLAEALDRLQTQNALIQEKEEALQTARQRLEAQSELRDRHVACDSSLGKWRALKTQSESALQQQHQERSAIAAAEKTLQEIAAPLTGLPALKEAAEQWERERVRMAQREGLQRQMQESTRRKTQLDGRIAALQPRAGDPAALEQQQSGLLRKEEMLEKELEDARQEVNRCHGQLEASQQAGEEVRDKRAHIVALGPDGECPTCTQRLQDHYEGVIRQLDARLMELREKYRLAREALEAAQVLVRKHDSTLQEIRREKERCGQQISANREAAATLQEALEDAAAVDRAIAEGSRALAALGESAYDAEKHQAVKSELEQLNVLQQRAARLQERVARRPQVNAEIDRLGSQIGELEQLIDTASREQSQLGFDETHYLACKRAVETADLELKHVKEIQAQLREEAAGHKKEQATLAETEKQQAAQRAEIADLQEEILYLSVLHGHLGKFRLELAGRLRPMIALQTSHLLSMTTSGRYGRVELDEDYTVALFDGNQAFPLARFSGGEQDLVNLCLRIAISQIVAQRSGAAIQLIVLDEIFGSQDEERKNLILNALGQLSSQFRQIFIITHIESIRDTLPVILEVSSEDDQRSDIRLF